MRLKPIYIYTTLIFIAVLTIIFVSQNNSVDVQNANTQIPSDEIHKSIQNNSPSAANVVSDIKKKIDDLDEYVKKNPKDTVKIREYAELLGAAHNPDKAIILYKSILDIDSARVDILSELSLIYFQKNEFNTAEGYINKILRLDRNNLQAKYNLGVIAFAKGEAFKAKEIWNNIIKNFPNSEISNMAKKNLESL